MLNTSRSYRTIRLYPVVQNLAQLRAELEEAGEGTPLEQVQVSAGMLLKDVVKAIGIPEQDQAYILGPKVETIASQGEG